MSDENDVSAAENTPLIGGRYRLSELIGAGGTASVFSADDTHSPAGDPHRRVAVRILHAHLVTDTAAVDAFLAPARMMGELAHPNIAGVLASGHSDMGGTVVPWIVMPLVAGVTAAERVKSAGPLDVVDALVVAAGLLRALTALHRAGFVHRDVTPNNVIIAAENSVDTTAVTLIDFGLTAPINTSTTVAATPERDSHIVGSIHFVSPEHARGLPVGERADIYQVGAVLYYLVTAEVPYPRPTARQVIDAHLSAPPPVASAGRPSIPLSVSRVITKAMAKTLRYRYESADDMLREVEELHYALAPEVTASVPREDAPTSAHNDGETVDPDTAATVIFQASAPSRRSAPDYLSGADIAQTTGISAVRARDTSPIMWTLLALTGLVVVAIIIAGATSVPPAPQNTEPPPAVVEPEPEPTTSPQVPPAIVTQSVPGLGSTLAEAQAALAAVGLGVTVVPENSPHVANTLMDASPAPGQTIARGGTVTVTVASGSNVLPRVGGMSLEDAAAAIRAAGFDPHTMRVVTADVVAGHVVDSVPAGDAVVPLGSGVTVYIAEKPPPVVVPPASPTPKPSPTLTPPPTESPPKPDPGDKNREPHA